VQAGKFGISRAENVSGGNDLDPSAGVVDLQLIDGHPGV